jgi:hypothetical protein
MEFVAAKMHDQMDRQALHRVRERLVSRRRSHSTPRHDVLFRRMPASSKTAPAIGITSIRASMSSRRRSMPSPLAMRAAAAP